MGKQVQIRPGFQLVPLTTGRNTQFYSAGDQVTLTDAEFGVLPLATVRALSVLGSVTDPDRDVAFIPAREVDFVTRKQVEDYVKTQAGPGFLKLARTDLRASTTVRPAGQVLIDGSGELYLTDGFLADKDLAPNLIAVPIGAYDRQDTGSDGPMINDVCAQAFETGKGVMLRSSQYRLREGVTIPNGLVFLGTGKGRSQIFCAAGGFLKFGLLDGTGGQQFPDVGQFTMNGTNAAISPLRVGYLTNDSVFHDIAITGALIGGAAVTVETTQNTQFYNLRLAQNHGDGMKFDLGAANCTLLDCVVRANDIVGLRLARTAAPPPNTSVVDVNRNIRVVGGLIENNDGGQVAIEAGLGVSFVDAQMSADSVSSAFPTLLLDVVRAGGLIDYVRVIGGQIKAGLSGQGTAVQVSNGHLVLEGGVNLREAEYGVEVDDGGSVEFGTVFLESTTNEGRAIGTRPYADLVTRRGRRNYTTGGMSITASTTLTPVPGFASTLDPGKVYEVDVWLAHRGDVAADFKLGWTAPDDWTMAWSADGYGAAVTTTPSGVNRALQAIGQVATVGTLDNPTTVAIRGYVTTTGDDPGVLQLMAAQAVSSASNVQILAVSRLRVVPMS